MSGIGGTLIIIGLLSFIVPFFGKQFLVVQALGDGIGGGLVCIALGVGLAGFSGIKNIWDVRRGKSQIEIERLKWANSGLDEIIFLKATLLSIVYGGNNLSTLNTLMAIYSQIYQKDVKREILDELASTTSDWAKPFIEDLREIGSTLEEEDKVLLLKSIYCLAWGDGEISAEEKRYLVSIAEKLQVPEDQFVSIIEETRSGLAA